MFEAFRSDGSARCINDKYRHRPPSSIKATFIRRNRNRSESPKPVIYKFTRRLAREKVLVRRKDVSRVKPDLGLRTGDSSGHLAVFAHLTPRLQKLLRESKQFQSMKRYEFYWAKLRDPQAVDLQIIFCFLCKVMSLLL